MAEKADLPDPGVQVRPLIQALPPGIQPRLMAELERAAADRYQTWAAQCPERVQAEGLRNCALREREVAKRVEALFEPQPDEHRHLRDALPRIAELYRAALANRPVEGRYAIQAAAERRGAVFRRSLASSCTDVALREALAICAELEEPKRGLPRGPLGAEPMTPS